MANQKKSSETVDEIMEIITDTLVEIVEALATRKNGSAPNSLRERITQLTESPLPEPEDAEEAENQTVVTVDAAQQSEAALILEATQHGEDGGTRSLPESGPAESSDLLESEAEESMSASGAEAVLAEPVPIPEQAEPDAQPNPAEKKRLGRLLTMLDPSGRMNLLEPEPTPERIPEKLPVIGMHRTLWKVAVLFMILLVVVNIPLPFTFMGVRGVPLARIIPDSKSLVIREGLIFKSENAPEVYVLGDRLEKRWITDITAFEFYNIKWRQVNIVDDDFVAQFEEGEPVYVLIKCRTSPHVYALEAGKKRWIKDIPTFEAQNFVWEQIMFKSCSEIARIPDGPPIPDNAGEPPST